jgi:putative hydrolase of the HAD superfamily
MNTQYLIWDFDGTLGYRDGRSWAVVLLEVLDRQAPGHPYVAEQIVPHLRTGFPWHTPERPHTHITDADQWWAEMMPQFERTFLTLGLDPGAARNFAGEVRATYCNPARFRLFDDTLPTLDELAARGWTHLLLSNHVPELGQLLSTLALNGYFAAVFNSAEIGYEKPHPAIFQPVLDHIGGADRAWMIGDNYQADILGAAGVGIPGILVRKFHTDASCFSPDLRGVPAIVDPSP